MNAIEMIIKTLEEDGVEYAFGIPGGAIEDLNIALYKSNRIKPIVTKHEQGAAFMADGYARVSNRLGVCFATAGPGASNLITGLATAYLDGIPVCAFTGQVAISLFGKGAFQESGAEGVNVVNIFRNFTKYSAMVLNEHRAEFMAQKVIRVAYASPTGPVHLSLPADVMKKQTDPTMPMSPKLDCRYFDQQKVNKTALILSMSKRPAIIAGWGTVLSRAGQALLDLAEKLDIPVATSPKAKGVFPESHPLSLGVLGFAGSPVAREYILDGDVDVLLAVGTSFNEFMTSGWDTRILPAENLIHIDVNPERIGKNYYTSIGIQGDARTVLEEIVRELDPQNSYDINGKVSKIDRRGDKALPILSQLRDKYQAPPKIEPSSNGYYNPCELIQDIQRSFPEDTIFFAEIGTIMAWSIRYLVMDKPYSFFVSLGFGGMGYGTAAPIGGKLASSDRPVVSLTGDGSFLMNGMEIATAVNYNIPVVWVIFNNAMHGMIYHGRRMFEDPVPEGIPSKFQRVDFAKVAEGLGAKGIRIEKGTRIDRYLIDEILTSGRPTVLDVLIDENSIPPINSRIETVIRHFAT